AIFGGKTQPASIFGQNQQPATNGSAFQPSTLFGTKPAETSAAAGQRSVSPEKKVAPQADAASTGKTGSDAPKAGGLFGGLSTPSVPASTAPKPASLFNATNGTSNE